MPSSDVLDRSLAATLKRLPRAQKTAQGAPAYSRFVNRPLGGYLAAIAYRAGATPNQVTVVSAVFTFAGIGAVAWAPPSWTLALVVTSALVVGYALDSADGQLARLRGGGSVAGEWLDHIVDSAKIATLHVAVLVAAFRFGELDPGLLLVPIGYGIVESVMFFAIILNDQLRRSRRVRPRASDGPPSTLRSLLVLPTDYGVLCLSFLLLGVPLVFGAVYAALFVANAVFLVAALVKWYREMRVLDSAATVHPGRS